MNSSIKNNIMLLFIVTVLTSCNYGETLQGYYVANQETPNFDVADCVDSDFNHDDRDMGPADEEIESDLSGLHTSTLPVEIIHHIISSE